MTGQNKGMQQRQAGASAIAMTCRNEQEFTRQKKRKMQSDLVKGRCQDDRLSLAACKQRATASLPLETERSCGNKQQRAKEKEESK